MTHANEDVIRQAYDSFASGDMDKFAGLLAADVVFHEVGRNRLSGEHRGKDAVLGLLANLGDLKEGKFEIEELHDVLANDDHVVSLHRSRGVRGGKTYQFNEAIVWHVRDGKIAESWTFIDDQYAWDEFLA